MRRTPLLTGMLVIAISTAWGTRLLAEDWRGFRGANGDSTSDGAGIFTKAGAVSLDVSWKHRIGSDEGAGWIARRNRLDRLLATLFPLK